jgi:hypothetical protein
MPAPCVVESARNGSRTQEWRHGWGSVWRSDCRRSGRLVHFTHSWWYSNEYGVQSDQVHSRHKPTDCDWGYAPLGDKGCHYEKKVTAYNSAGDAVAGDSSPECHHHNDGTNDISCDSGKTWTTLPDGQSCTVNSVEIGWTKVEDN